MTDKIDDAARSQLGTALGRIPSGLFVLTARNEDRRTGILVSWVQQACFQPPMVSVAIGKQRRIMPLISESRCFGLCQIPDDDTLLIRKFAGRIGPQEDPFLGFELHDGTVTRVPILAGCLGYLECELVCHVDVEGDHDLFVGRARGGGYFRGQPRVHLRDNGFKY